MVHRRPYILCVLILAGVFSARTADAGEPGFKVERNIVYGKGGDVDLQLDIATPEGKGERPCIVCIHGGGWRAGKRQDVQPLIVYLAKQGFVAATVTYRLAPMHPYPAQINDCKASIRWLRANAAKYGINKDRIGAVGFSAGAHLSCLLGTADESAKLEGNGGNPKESSRVQAVVSFFGPTDFTHGKWSEKVQTTFLIPFLGGKLEEKADAAKSASPIVHCSKDDPPFLFFHGAKDDLVPISESELMVERLKKVGVSASLVTFPDDGHGWGGEKLTRSFTQTSNFFQKHLKK